MSWKVWQGVKTIGGNILEVRGRTGRILTDFGVAGLSLNEIGTAEELLATKSFPEIPGIFQEDQTLAQWETALVISHLHLDHMGALRFLPAHVTVYLSERSHRLYQLLQEVGDEPTPQCQIRLLPDKGQVQIGDIQVTAYPSDHDVVGTVALFIETPFERILHSGDLRLSGYHPERVERWVQKAKAWQPEVLFIEGTAFSFEDDQDAPPQGRTERQLLQTWNRLLKEQRTVYVVNFYLRNVERMRHFLEESRSAGRELVFEEKYARVLQGMYPQVGQLTVLQETLATPTKASKVNFRMIDLAEITINPRRYSIQNSFTWRKLIQKLPGCRYFHSNGEPLGAYDPNFKILEEFLASQQIELESLQASGHAEKAELLKIVQAIQPQSAAPWHSFQPEAFSKALSLRGQQIWDLTSNTISEEK